LPIRQTIVEIEIEIEIAIDSCPGWHLALMDCSNFAAELPVC
jgi:DNA-binding XRE family transcriptional regulator